MQEEEQEFNSSTFPQLDYWTKKKTETISQPSPVRASRNVREIPSSFWSEAELESGTTTLDCLSSTISAIPLELAEQSTRKGHLRMLNRTGRTKGGVSKASFEEEEYEDETLGFTLTNNSLEAGVERINIVS